MVKISLTKMFGLYFNLLIVGLAFGAQLRNGNRCETRKCEIKPFDLRFWYQGIEIELRQLNINEGDDVIITCDGSCVGASENPRLNWYGPNLRRIEENGNNRTYTEKSSSGQFNRLILNGVTAMMSGRYTCRGWLGQRMGWRKKEINIAVDQSRDREVTQKITIPADVVFHQSRDRGLTQKITIPADVVSHRSRDQGFAQKITIPPDVKSHVNNSSKFTCTSGVMIDANKVCDGFPDCVSGNDESNCVIGSICSEGTVACADNEKCIPREQICDSVVHCRDGSDERPTICNI